MTTEPFKIGSSHKGEAAIWSAPSAANPFPPAVPAPEPRRFVQISGAPESDGSGVCYALDQHGQVFVHRGFYGSWRPLPATPQGDV